MVKNRNKRCSKRTDSGKRKEKDTEDKAPKTKEQKRGSGQK